MSSEALKRAKKAYESKISRVSLAINPESDPIAHQALEDLLKKHGGRGNKGAIAAALREAIVKTVPDSEFFDLSSTINVTMSMNRELLLALNEKAVQRGLTLPELINQALESA